MIDLLLELPVSYTQTGAECDRFEPQGGARFSQRVSVGLGLANTVFVVAESSRYRAECLMDKLTEGMTVNDTVEWMVDHAKNHPFGKLALRCKDNLPDPYPRSQDKPGDYTIYGDTSTRIKTVYTGDQGNSVGWYRKL